MIYPSELPSEYDQHGFDRAELIDFLSTEGIHISVNPDAAPTEEKAEIPEWAKSLKATKRFTFSEAADILIGLDPWHKGWRGDDGEREFNRVCTTLAQAVEDGDLLSVATDDDNRPLFRAQDLRAWAASVGFDWCIPAITPVVAATAAVATDDATLTRLRQLEAENAHLVGLVQGMDQALREAKEALKQAPQEVGPAPQQATAAPQDDDEKPLSTKERGTLLRLVTGMAVQCYKFDPSSNRNTAATRIADDLAMLGIKIDPDTVRNYLKKGAETVLPASATRP